MPLDGFNLFQGREKNILSGGGLMRNTVDVKEFASDKFLVQLNGQTVESGLSKSRAKKLGRGVARQNAPATVRVRRIDGRVVESFNIG